MVFGMSAYPEERAPARGRADTHQLDAAGPCGFAASSFGAPGFGGEFGPSSFPGATYVSRNRPQPPRAPLRRPSEHPAGISAPPDLDLPPSSNETEKRRGRSADDDDDEEGCVFALDDDGAGLDSDDGEELGDSLGALNLEDDDGDDDIATADLSRTTGPASDGAMARSPPGGPNRNPAFGGGARGPTRSRCSSFSDKPEPPLGASPLLLNVFQQIAAEKCANPGVPGTMPGRLGSAGY